MGLHKFISKRFSAASEARIVQCNDIIENYLGQGLRLTLRQLYYQLVTRNFITNEEKSYKNLSTLVSDARLAGLMDWDAIEDRVRQPRLPTQWDSIQDLVEAAVSGYRLPRWEGQDYYVELWVEKDALAGVLRPLASEFHVTMMVNRGYSSQSAMYESAGRFKENAYEDDDDGDGNRSQKKEPLLFYLGDHDPSGEDMVRDIRDRMQTFGVYDLTVEKLALTWEQIRQYNPPPNPAKISDPRAAAYIAKHGNNSWEVDALPPELLARIIRAAFLPVVDMNKMKKITAKEERDKIALRKVAENL